MKIYFSKMKRNYANLKTATRTTTMQGIRKSDILSNNNKVVKFIMRFLGKNPKEME